MKTFRHIIITGASSGIGEALAIDYAATGVVLGLTGRDARRLSAVADACRAKGAIVLADTVDTTDRSAMAHWLRAFDDAYPVDLLIANAGISLDQNNLGIEPFDSAHRTIAVNVTGVLNTVEPLIDRLVARRAGQVGVIASLAAFFGRPRSASYNASKAAIRVWGESLRFPLAKANVGLSVVCPGYVTSRMTDAIADPRPKTMSTGRASQIIRQGLSRNRPRIAFPFGLAIGVWFTALLPAWLSARMLKE